MAKPDPLFVELVDRLADAAKAQAEASTAIEDLSELLAQAERDGTAWFAENRYLRQRNALLEGHLAEYRAGRLVLDQRLPRWTGTIVDRNIVAGSAPMESSIVVNIDPGSHPPSSQNMPCTIILTEHLDRLQEQVDGPD